MNYRTIENMNDLIQKNINNFHGFDLIVGIPRSGMLPASIISLKVNASLCSLDEYISNSVLKSGITGRHKSKFETAHDVKKVLVVDDSIQSGRSMEDAKSKIPLELRKNCKFCVIFGTKIAPEGLVDFSLERVERPRVFEWNIFHHSTLSSSCVDIDGVLCDDIDRSDDDDGVEYIKKLAEVNAYIKPTKEIDTLVTNRLEKYRKETEQWLDANSIKYKCLIMNPAKTAEERRALNNYSKHKAKAYIESNNLLFIESSKRQSIEIANISGKPVICTDDNSINYPGVLNSISKKSGLTYILKKALFRNQLFMNFYRKWKNK
ncbi:phosphoribosyltransferase family protein [Pseudoalteromonas shioyasakiensis]|uniref:phosphoribosyltransferase family protein n=1 Tax=Pseudoalteromonas shioyasakiensis TaxID=1190813 RepID=UPI002117AE2B|nr:phosphoribosyltransferase family protein [Pseudoalteromonas shioyasakiensis]MCQ8881304.1 phosphoribosyltransferase family protein [Pseudoalteromonas shioyasakiensis]